MDCREFQDKHALLIDVRCSALDENEMRDHMRECPRCARQDMLVRRSLLLVRNLASIEPSPDFRARLDARLRDVGAHPLASLDVRPAGRVLPAWIATAAAVLAIAVIGMRTFSGSAEPIMMPPVVASSPAFEHSTLASPALVATVPTGMSVWPAIMVASQVPVHFAATELADER
jgi:hypothetical protein